MPGSRFNVFRKSNWFIWAVHVLIWFVIWLILRHFSVPNLTKDNNRVVLHGALTIWGESVFIFYFLGYLVFPKFLYAGNIAKLFLVLIVLFQAIYLLNYFEFRYLASISDAVANNNSLYVFRVWHLFMAKSGIFGCLSDISIAFINYSWSFFYVTPLLAVKITIDIIESRTRNLVLERDLLKLEAANSNLSRDQLQLQRDYLMLEVSFLRSQVNPHFLFNNLNAVYSKLIDKDDEAAGIIVELASLMRYSLYLSAQEFVPLEDELSYIRSYVELETRRHSDILDVNFEEPSPGLGVQIAPLIMIAFVENAFKHVGFNNNAFVNISIQVHDGRIAFRVVNSLFTKTLARTQSAQPGGGVGLENVRKRLEIIYKDNYQLEIIKKNDRFEVLLLINVKEQLSY